MTLKAYDLLKDLDFNFIGNIEGYDIYDGDIDVIVCDGFVGNIVLKVTERVFKLTFEFVWQEPLQNFLLSFHLNTVDWYLGLLSPDVPCLDAR